MRQVLVRQITEAATKATRTVVKAMTVVGDTVEGSARRNAAGNTGHKAGRPHFKQPTFNWSAKDKYTELKNFKIGVRNISMKTFMIYWM